MITTVGQVLVNDALPPQFRDYGRVMDSKGIEDVLESIAREAPEEYSGVTKRLMDIGNAAAFDTGTTIRLSDLRPAYDKKPLLQAIDIAEAQIRNDKNLTDAQKSEMIEKLYDKANSRIVDETYNAELARRNQLALQVASKARGNKTQLAAFISTPGTYADPSGKMVPMFIRHSYAEGLTPAEYWAGSFGARTGVVSTKTATAKGGAFGKLLSASAIAQVVTEEDCETESGLPVKVDDDDNIGAVLARPAGGYEAGTVITKNVLSDLRKDKRHDEIVIRSPVTCGCKDGVCSKCAGIRETGGFPPIGYNLGTNAASAFAERITQGALNCLAEGTLVRMADGSVRKIEDISPGDMVIGSDLDGNLVPTPVLNWYDNGIQPCFETIFRGFNYDVSLKSTNIHKLLCASDDVEKYYKDNVRGVHGYGKFLRKNDAIGSNVVIPVGETLLKTHALVINEDGDKEYFFSSTSMDIGPKHVYDIEIGTPEHIFLLANGLVVSNTKHCLVEGTLVKMGDGSVKSIENIKVGDIVRGSDRNGHTAPARVINTFDNGIEPCVRAMFSPGINVECTTEHKFLVISKDGVSEQKRLRDLIPGDMTTSIKIPGTGSYEYIGYMEIGNRHVYDITVDNDDHLFVLAADIVVSNSGKALKGKGSYQGFQMFTSLAKVPKVFPDRATLSTVDGTVTKIEEAPQGGTYIFVDDGSEEKRHYVAPGYDIEVKEGQEVEAGDQMSDGVIDPSELVKYKGIGEGRKYWANRFTQAIRDSGMAANRRNAEVLARTVMNTVKLENEDEAGEGLPGDVLTYTAWSHGFKPRHNSTIVAPTVASIGKYLEQPVLHYTIGTRITPSVIRTLKKFKIEQMMVNDTHPEVTPFMERIEDSNAEKKDWMARLGTTYLKSRLQEDVARGAESRLHSTEPYPGIAKGVEFGDWGQPLSKNKSEHFTY